MGKISLVGDISMVRKAVCGRCGKMKPWPYASKKDVPDSNILYFICDDCCEELGWND